MNRSISPLRRLRYLSILACLAGCFSTTTPGLAGSDGHLQGVPGTDSGTQSSAADGGTPAPLQPNVDAGPVAKTPSTGKSTSDKIDLLFIVDNSNSMREEQAALRKEFPRLMTTLTTGLRDGKPYAAPVKDLHVGVVSVNMGLIGVQGIPGCSGQSGDGPNGFGDDGLLQHKPTQDPGVMGCKSSYPQYLSFIDGQNDPAQVAQDFACIATLGTGGCGFEQQLESGLKALWPSVDVDPTTGKVSQPNRITFLSDTANPEETFGHGDKENKGFLRSDSLLAVVLVTDEEDCSSKTTVHFTPQQFLQPSDPLYNQDLNLRCFYNPQNLYAVQRYVAGLKALRSSDELVVFSSIVGVPGDLIDSSVDFGNDTQRNAYYDKLMADARMQQRPDPTRIAGDGNLIPSCVTATSTAYAPRRIVDVTRGFGKNGRVASICDADFAPAIDSILDMMAPHIAKQ